MDDSYSTLVTYPVLDDTSEESFAPAEESLSDTLIVHLDYIGLSQDRRLESLLRLHQGLICLFSCKNCTTWWRPAVAMWLLKIKSNQNKGIIYSIFYSIYNYIKNVILHCLELSSDKILKSKLNIPIIANIIICFVQKCSEAKCVVENKVC